MRRRAAARKKPCATSTWLARGLTNVAFRKYLDSDAPTDEVQSLRRASAARTQTETGRSVLHLNILSPIGVSTPPQVQNTVSQPCHTEYSGQLDTQPTIRDGGLLECSLPSVPLQLSHMTCFLMT